MHSNRTTRGVNASVKDEMFVITTRDVVRMHSNRTTKGKKQRRACGCRATAISQGRVIIITTTRDGKRRVHINKMMGKKQQQHDTDISSTFSNRHLIGTMESRIIPESIVGFIHVAGVMIDDEPRIKELALTDLSGSFRFHSTYSVQKPSEDELTEVEEIMLRESLNGLNFGDGTEDGIPYHQDMVRRHVEQFLSAVSDGQKRALAFQGDGVEKSLLEEMNVPFYSFKYIELSHRDLERAELLDCGRHISNIGNGCSKVMVELYRICSQMYV